MFKRLNHPLYQLEVSYCRPLSSSRRRQHWSCFWTPN